MDQVERLDRLVDSILASVRSSRRSRRRRADRRRGGDREVVDSIEPIVASTASSSAGSGSSPWPIAPRLRQILEHLIENAVKYAPPDTTITIDLPLVEGSVRIGVTDQGPGVPEEWRERIFEPYRPARHAHRARLGIGLYAAKRLGESMGARLWCEPAEPTGRSVRPLPARPPPPSSMRS
jgi:signal transduction histidine kinase